jgi:uncharacterized membrane protein (UPF0127 family)
MHQVVIRNLNRPDLEPINAVFCDTFFCRLRGLTFHKPLIRTEGLLLVQKKNSRIDSSIHMIGVNFPLAIIWINQLNEIVDTCLALPWRLAYFPRYTARYVLELSAERITDFSTGESISIEKSVLS